MQRGRARVSELGDRSKDLWQKSKQTTIFLYSLHLALSPSMSVSWLFLFLLAASCSALDQKIDCPEGKYYDNGLQKCEPCDDFCRYTSLPSYVQLCQEHCPKVYRQLMDEQKQPGPEADFLSDADKPPVSDDSTLPLGGKVALGIVGALAVVAAVVGIVVFKKVQQKKAATQNPRRNGAATENNREYRSEKIDRRVTQ